MNAPGQPESHQFIYSYATSFARPWAREDKHITPCQPRYPSLGAANVTGTFLPFSAETAGENMLSIWTRPASMKSIDSGTEFQKPPKNFWCFKSIKISNKRSNSSTDILPISVNFIAPLASAANTKSNKPMVGSLMIPTFPLCFLSSSQPQLSVL